MLNWKSLLYSDKPVSLSVKSFLIRKMATATMIPEKTLEAVVNHQLASMLDAMSLPSVHSVEMSGFCKFIFLKKKANTKLGQFLQEQKNYMDKLASPHLTPYQKKMAEIKLSRIEMGIKGLNSKLKPNESITSV